MSPILPRLVAFDLDATLWEPEMYLLDGAPFKKDSQGRVRDRSGQEVYLMADSRAILEELATDPQWEGVEVAYVSRTEYPEWAMPCLQLLQVAPDHTMHDLGSHFEIYPGCKRSHFAAIHKRSGIDYKDMIFFDNERRNVVDCASLGITCVYTPDGMTHKAWKAGLAQFAKQRAAAGSSA